MNQYVIILVLCLGILSCQSKYIIGNQGDSCFEACFNLVSSTIPTSRLSRLGNELQSENCDQ